MKMGKIHCITSLRLRPLSNLSGSHRLCLPVELRPTATSNLSHSPQPPNFTAQSHLPSCKPWPPLGRFFFALTEGNQPISVQSSHSLSQLQTFLSKSQSPFAFLQPLFLSLSYLFVQEYFTCVMIRVIK